MDLSQAETEKWLHLRAIEWANWPAFLSQLVAPILFVFYPWYGVIVGILIVSALWCLVRDSFTSPALANAGCLAVAWMKWPPAIICSVYLIVRHSYVASVLAIAWPFLAGFICLGGMVGRIELNFAKRIGYVSEQS